MFNLVTADDKDVLKGLRYLFIACLVVFSVSFLLFFAI